MKHSHINRQDGFTLIEILAVILIIFVLAGLILGTAGHVQRLSDIKRTRAEIAAIEAALEAYKNDYGTYPSSLSAVKPYLPGFSFIDPYNVAYKYVYPGINNSASFDLWSTGPNGGLSGGTVAMQAADDITNWSR